MLGKSDCTLSGLIQGITEWKQPSVLLFTVELLFLNTSTFPCGCWEETRAPLRTPKAPSGLELFTPRLFARVGEGFQLVDGGV